MDHEEWLIIDYCRLNPIVFLIVITILYMVPLLEWIHKASSTCYFDHQLNEFILFYSDQKRKEYLLEYGQRYLLRVFPWSISTLLYSIIIKPEEPRPSGHHKGFHIDSWHWWHHADRVGWTTGGLFAAALLRHVSSEDGSDQIQDMTLQLFWFQYASVLGEYARTHPPKEVKLLPPVSPTKKEEQCLMDPSGPEGTKGDTEAFL